MSTLFILPATYEAMRAHGEETYPHECCGALLGLKRREGWRVVASVRADNTRTDSPHNRYSIDPRNLVQIERKARQEGWEVAGFYHSHPDHPAQWSAVDLLEAHWLDCLYVITAVVQGNATETNAFLLTGLNEEDKRFDLQAVLIEG